MEHHPVFAEGDGSAVAIGCDVPDGEERHDSAVENHGRFVPIRHLPLPAMGQLVHNARPANLSFQTR